MFNWSKNIFTGETLFEMQQRLLKERELKIRSALERLRRKRHLLRSQRKHRDFPIVSVMGYTNCGEVWININLLNYYMRL